MSSGFAEQDRRIAAPTASTRGPGHDPAEPTASPASGSPNWIERIVEATEPGLDAMRRAETAARLRQFLDEPSPWKALLYWIGPGGASLGRRAIAEGLSRDLARLDALLSEQVNAILHHPAFQRLEASWRGLRYLVDQNESETVKIRVLNVTWTELSRDLERAIEFDQSQLFRKVYSEEFGTAGGEPLGVLLGDYEIRPQPSLEHPTDDVATLRAISGVAAAAFAPLITGVHPSMFGLDDFSTLEQSLNLRAHFDQVSFLKWKAFRESEDARFVGLALPRVLMRLPYEDDGSRIDGFTFHEEVAGPDRSKYLWGNAAYAFGAVLMRSFAESGWLADIRGVRRDVAGGGLVAGLPSHCFSTDRRGVAAKSSTEVAITDFREKDLSELGFLPLCHCADTEFAAFYTAQSTQQPKKYDELAATMNAKISAMLQYTFCVSQFAHYLKVVARDKIGSFQQAEECEDFLHRWLQQYVTSDAEASPEIKAELPLREASVRVREHPQRPGSYVCVAHLWPHFGLDELATTLRVTTELTPGRPE